MHYRLTTDEMIDAKHVFELLAEQHGVRILHYHCDNGRFANKAFVDDVQMAHQTITFCGVGAHHQNGGAERHIRDIMENARTSLLHAAYRWPKAIAANLWPQAINHVMNVRNSLPGQEKLSHHCPSSLERLYNPTSSIFICLAAQSTYSRHLSRPGVHSLVGENTPELAFPYAIPPSCVLRPAGPVNPSRACQPKIPLCI